MSAPTRADAKKPRTGEPGRKKAGTKAAPKPRGAGAARAPVDPRVRDRWVAARRAEGRRRLRALVLVGALLALAVVAWLVVASPLLDVDHIRVKGGTRVTAEEIRAASGITTGDPMVWLDGGAAERRLRALPWVASARVEREWPGTVTITVTEREPVAWVDGGAGPALVDGTGRVLSIVEAPPEGFPQIVDPARVPPVGAAISPATGAHVARDLVGYARPATRTIAVTDRGVVLVLQNGAEVRIGSPRRVMTKVVAARAVLDAVGETVSYVDVSVPSNPVAGPAR
jgi:cell division protein FtsQ